MLLWKTKDPNLLLSRSARTCGARRLISVRLALAQRKGIGIHIYLRDWLFSKPFGWRMAARHSLFWRAVHCPLAFESDAGRYLAEFREWVYATGCLAHACSKALKWGLRPMGGRGDAMVLPVFSSASPSSFRLMLYVTFRILISLMISIGFGHARTYHRIIDLFVRVNRQWSDDRLHSS